MGTDVRSNPWIPFPDDVAALLGRVAFYAAWLDDVLGDAIIAASTHLSDEASTTPGWAASGTRLVEALASLETADAKVSEIARTLASHLADLTATRNQLLHGVWLWEGDSVLVMKRSLAPGRRRTEYDRFTYAEIEELIGKYQQLGSIAERFARMVKSQNSVARARDLALIPSCPRDDVPLDAALVDDVIVWQCRLCGHSQPA